MNIVVEAVYENGVFRPTTPVAALAEGTSVVFTIQTPSGAEARQSQRSLTPEELHASIRSKATNSEDEIPEHLWEELKKASERATSNVRDPEVMRQAAEHMDRLSADVYKRVGLLNIAVPFLREMRDEE